MMSDSPTANNPGGLPYAGGDDEDLGGDRAWYRKPGTVIGVVVLVLLVVAAIVFLSGGDDGGDETDTTVSSPTAAVGEREGRRTARRVSPRGGVEVASASAARCG
jgi:hypothetical protein